MTGVPVFVQATLLCRYQVSLSRQDSIQFITLEVPADGGVSIPLNCIMMTRRMHI